MYQLNMTQDEFAQLCELLQSVRKNNNSDIADHELKKFEIQFKYPEDCYQKFCDSVIEIKSQENDFIKNIFDKIKEV